MVVFENDSCFEKLGREGKVLCGVDLNLAHAGWSYPDACRSPSVERQRDQIFAGINLCKHRSSNT
jgi:hypothetical protein